MRYRLGTAACASLPLANNVKEHPLAEGAALIGSGPAEVNNDSAATDGNIPLPPEGRCVLAPALMKEPPGGR
jgi:hypothetical protein